MDQHYEQEAVQTSFTLNRHPFSPQPIRIKATDVEVVTLGPTVRMVSCEAQAFSLVVEKGRMIRDAAISSLISFICALLDISDHSLPMVVGVDVTLFKLI